MIDKPLWQSKTVWGSILIAASYVIEGHWIQYHSYADMLRAIGIALGGVGVRDAIRKGG